MPLWNIHSSSPAPLPPRNIFFFPFPANAHFAVPRVWHRGRCASPLCATSGESLRLRVFHLTVARLPHDASHLRHTAPASFRTICLLIDLSLVGRVLWILWGEKCILTDSTHTIVFETEKNQKKKNRETLSAPGGELAVMCLSCLKRAVGRGFNGVASQQFHSPRLVCFTLASIKLFHLNTNCQSLPLLLPSSESLSLSLLFLFTSDGLKKPGKVWQSNVDLTDMPPTFIRPYFSVMSSSNSFPCR